MADVARGDRPKLRRQNSRHCDGPAGEGNELDFVGCAVAMDVDHGAHISCLQTLLAKVLSKHHIIMFLNHNAAKGYAVIRPGRNLPSSPSTRPRPDQPRHPGTG